RSRGRRPAQGRRHPLRPARRGDPAGDRPAARARAPSAGDLRHRTAHRPRRRQGPAPGAAGTADGGNRMIAGEATRQAVVSAGDRILLIGPDGRSVTGRDLEARTTGLALALQNHGLASQRIGLWSWNSAAAIEAHLATEWIGATRVPVDPGAP